MNADSLKKLNMILWKKWNSIMDEHFMRPGKHVVKAHFRWREVCDSLEIERTQEMGECEFDPRGEILEDSVVVNDPALYGAWVQIPKETALKILAIGMP